jgi:hypothetical protein
MVKKTFRPIMVDSELAMRIKYIAGKIGCSQNQLLNDIILPLYMTKEVEGKIWLESYPSVRKKSVLFQWYGTPTLISGQIPNVQCLGERTNSILSEHVMQQDIETNFLKKTEKKKEKAKKA